MKKEKEKRNTDSRGEKGHFLQYEHEGCHLSFHALAAKCHLICEAFRSLALFHTSKNTH